MQVAARAAGTKLAASAALERLRRGVSAKKFIVTL